MSKKYYEVKFSAIPTNYAAVTYDDVWTVEEYTLNGETVKANKYGFDPHQTGKYMPDEYWMMSDDLRFWDIAQNAMKKYDKLVKLFPERKNQEKQEKKESKKQGKFRILEDEGRVIKENKERKGRVQARIIGSSSEWVCAWDCETLDGKKFLAYFGDELWYANIVINTITSIDVLNQKLYEIDGKKIAVVQAWRY